MKIKTAKIFFIFLKNLLTSIFFWSYLPPHSPLVHQQTSVRRSPPRDVTMKFQLWFRTTREANVRCDGALRCADDAHPSSTGATT
jgi:hypothetical protein